MKDEMKDPTFFENRKTFSICSINRATYCVDSADRAENVLGMTSEKAENPAIAVMASHLTSNQKSDLQLFFTKYKSMFYGSIGDWDAEPVFLELKHGVTRYHCKSYPVTVQSKSKLKKELQHLISLSILEKDRNSICAAPSFTVPKNNSNKVRLLMDFRQLNQRTMRKHFSLTGISEILYEIDGMQWASALYPKMGYYAIWLDPDAQNYCTFITPWGKYTYLRLPMGIICAPEIFHEKMSALVARRELERVYIDDLLVLSKDTLEDHLEKLNKVLHLIEKVQRKCNSDKCTFCTTQVEYLG